MPNSESGLRRKLDKMGYGLRKRSGLYLIFDYDTRGTVHPTVVSPYCLDLEEVREWADILAEPEDIPA